MSEQPDPSTQPLKSEAPTGRPVPPLPLDYGRSSYPDPKGGSSALSHAAAGFFFWFTAVAVAFFFLMYSGSNAIDDRVAQVFVGCESAAVIAVTLWVRLKLKWRGFIPGMLLGCGMICLVPVGIAAVLCGGWKL